MNKIRFIKREYNDLYDNADNQYTYDTFTLENEKYLLCASEIYTGSWLHFKSNVFSCKFVW